MTIYVMADGAPATLPPMTDHVPAIYAPAPSTYVATPFQTVVISQNAPRAWDADVITPQSVKRCVALVLPGGGAHGVCGAAMLATLLTHPDFQDVYIKTMTGVSAGALNGAIAASQLHGDPRLPVETRRDLARHQIHSFWEENTIDKFWWSAARNAAEYGIAKLINNTSLAWMNAVRGAFPDMGLYPQNPLPRSAWSSPYTTGFMSELIDANFRNYSPLAGMPHMNVGTTMIEDIRNVNPVSVLHTDEDINRDPLLASMAINGCFAPVLLNGVHHIDGGYSEHPNLTPIDSDPEITDEIWLKNSASPEFGPNMDSNIRMPNGWPLTPKRSWEAVAKRQSRDDGQGGIIPGEVNHNVHIISPPSNTMPKEIHTLVIPHRDQNQYLWEIGSNAANHFVANVWKPHIAAHPTP